MPINWTQALLYSTPHIHIDSITYNPWIQKACQAWKAGSRRPKVNKRSRWRRWTMSVTFKWRSQSIALRFSRKQVSLPPSTVWTLLWSYSHLVVDFSPSVAPTWILLSNAKWCKPHLPLLSYNTMDEHKLHAHLNDLANRLAKDKKHIEDLNHLLKVAEDHFWWAIPIESINSAQVEKYKRLLEELKTHVDEKCEKLLFEGILTYNSSTQFFYRWKLLFQC